MIKTFKVDAPNEFFNAYYTVGTIDVKYSADETHPEDKPIVFHIGIGFTLLSDIKDARVFAKWIEKEACKDWEKQKSNLHPVMQEALAPFVK